MKDLLRLVRKRLKNNIILLGLLDTDDINDLVVVSYLVWELRVA